MTCTATDGPAVHCPHRAEGRRVKPLEWCEDWCGEWDDVPQWVTSVSCGWRISFNSAGLGHRDHKDAPPEWVAQKKADAQAHYEARILSCLEPAAPAVAEAAKVLLATDDLFDALCLCDGEAAEIANRISGKRGERPHCPDGVQVLEDAETIMRAALRALAGEVKQ